MGKNRLTRKQLQADELEDALVGARDFVFSHRQETTKWAVIGAAALLLFAIVWGATSLRATRLAARLSNTLALMDAPLVTDGAGGVPGQRIFKDAAERTSAVRKELKALAQDAPSSTPGRTAACILMSFEGKSGVTGRVSDSIKALARSENGTVMAGVAAASLMDAQAAAGRAKEAIELARRYLEATDSPLPKDILMFTLAQLYEKTGDTTQAKGFYQRVVSDFPDSPKRSDAQQKLSAL